MNLVAVYGFVGGVSSVKQTRFKGRQSTIANQCIHTCMRTNLHNTYIHTCINMFESMYIQL